VRIERRGRRLYLYDTRWIGGRPCKQYHGRIDEAAAAEFRLRHQAEQVRLSAQRARVRQTAQRAADLLAAGAEFDQLAENLFRTVMRLLGFEQHHRGEWRPKRGTAMASARDLLRPAKRVGGIIQLESPDPEIAQLLAAGARGDSAILPAASKFLHEKNLLKKLGSVALWAENLIVEWVAGQNVVVAACVRTQLRADIEDLLKDDVKPSAAERLIATRAAHNAAVVHALEVLMVRESPGSPAAAALGKDLGRAEGRLLTSLRSLATLRRLRLPTVNVGQVNVGSAVLNNRGKSRKPSKGRVGGSRNKSEKALGS
jgi:hypothetical protein